MTNTETFGDYALPDAQTIARVFLPLVDLTNPGSTTSWAALQEVAAVEFTCDVNWIEYLGWGTGDGSFSTNWRPSMGRAPSDTIERVMQLLAIISGSVDNWEFQPFSEITTSTETSTRGSLMNLGQFAALWKGRPLPGNIRDSKSVSMMAPAYADSVVISGPSNLVDVGLELGLEIKTVSKHRALPTTVW